MFFVIFNFCVSCWHVTLIGRHKEPDLCKIPIKVILLFLWPVFTFELPSLRENSHINNSSKITPNHSALEYLTNWHINMKLLLFPFNFILESQAPMINQLETSQPLCSFCLTFVCMVFIILILLQFPVHGACNARSIAMISHRPPATNMLHFSYYWHKFYIFSCSHLYPVYFQPFSPTFQLFI